MEEEIWRDVKGYEGLYQASSLGRVRSLDRVIEQTLPTGKSVRRHYKGKLLSCTLDKGTGYNCVSLQTPLLSITNIHCWYPKNRRF